MADAIFNAYAAAEAVGAEIDRLVTTLPEAFTPQLSLQRVDLESVDNDWVNSRLGYHFELRGAVARQRLPGQLLLAFDLYRPHERSEWPHARASLLTCAYAPKLEDGWDLDDVLIGMDGRLLSSETFLGCSQHADRRLLEWGRGMTDWNRRAWLFTVPLLAIGGHEALQRELVNPILDLLLSNVTPEQALEETCAVRFSSVSD